MPMTIILASASPRRRAFFRELGFRFRVVVPRVVEEPRKGEAPRAFAQRAAVDKARWVAARQKRPSARIVVAADTIVVLGRQILGKPKDKRDAARMLRALSGRWHEVITGVCVLGPRKRTSFVARTPVQFKRLTRREIEAYIASGEPMDKAGAYAIQGIGSFMVRAIRGSYSNVVGLPVAELVDVLEKDFGVR
ncbi:MAG: Maf family protein [Verrucomicrobiota bacterium]